MKTIRLGNTGLHVSQICLGMMSYGSPSWRDWVLELDEARPFIQRAVEKGINFFDTANAYSAGVSEEVTGKLLKEFTKRDEVVVATKVFFNMGESPNTGGLSRKAIMTAVDNSLRRLDMDYIDLYQIHRWDYNTPIEETMEALHDVVKAGKVRYIGASSMFAWQFSKAQYTATLNGWTRFVSMQNHYNLVYREEEREMIPLCNDMGVGIIPWSPLARGLLAGGRSRESLRGESKRSKSDQYVPVLYTSSDFDIVDRVVEVAAQYAAKPAQIALAWLLHKDGVTAPIIGATKMHHLDEAIDAAGIELSAETIAYLEEPYQPHSIRGHSYSKAI